MTFGNSVRSMSAIRSARSTARSPCRRSSSRRPRYGASASGGRARHRGVWLRLRIALFGVGRLALVVFHEMMHLAEHRAERRPSATSATRIVCHRAVGLRRPELAGLFGEIHQDGAGLEQGDCPLSRSTMAGMRLFGLILRNSGLNCSSLLMSTACAAYGRPHSSSMIETLRPFGVDQV